MAIQLSTDLPKRILETTGENVFLCYQCVKCTSGCPLAEHFDLAPNQVMRAAQLGMEDLVYGSKTAWLCASCQTCTTRCPQGIDIARIMDFVVSEAAQQGMQAMVPESALFNKVFLRNIDILGRAYELGLIAELKLRTGRLTDDLDLGLEMFRRGKLRLLPEVVLRRKHRAKPPAEARPAEEVGYYPGCSLHGLAAEFDRSARSAMEALGFNPIEPEGWICCGSTPAHRVDHELATRLPLENLILLEEQGFREVALPCASCFSRFRTAAHDLRLEPDLKGKLDAEIGYEYRDSLEIRSLLDYVVNRIGLEAVAEKVRKPLEGLKVACYYGCLLTRPPEITGSIDPEYPMAMDRLMETLGATAIPWDRKVSCCGAQLSLTQRDLVLEMSGHILANARARGADLLAVACPLCHANLDGRQIQMPGNGRLPALYFTQLMAVAFGRPKDAALERNLIDPRPLLGERGLL